MNWAAWMPALITVLGWIFTAGMVAGRIKNQELTLKDHHETLKDYGGKLENLGTRMTAAEAWREGYNAGKTSQR